MRILVLKPCTLEREFMIKYTDQATMRSRIFKTPFENELSTSNRWVQLERVVPWDKMAKIFMSRLSKDNGRAGIDLRIVMGAMYIQHSLNLTDRGTIDAIQENIYMQYFVGLASFQVKPIFDHSLLSIFRKRLGKKGSEELVDVFLDHAIQTEGIKHRKASVKPSVKQGEKDKKKDKKDGDSINIGSPTPSNSPSNSPSNRPSKKQTSEDVKAQSTDITDSSNNSPNDIDKETIKCNDLTKKDETTGVLNRGTVKIDATVAPQNISFPTDTKLLNHARVISEEIIDALYGQKPSLWKVKPRTYRRKAREGWLRFSKSRRPSSKYIRRQKKSSLSYLRRNLKYIEELFDRLQSHGEVVQIQSHLYRKLFVISEVYRQQKEMYDKKTKKVANRIVSIAQPWVRPIVRGKAGSPVEFGAKINLSLTEKMVRVDQSSFDAFNEGQYLIEQLESYKARFGYYPEYALVDKIYLTRENRTFMKEHGIKHTGRPLGRPPKDAKRLSAKLRKKNNERNHVEGKIGQAKLKYGLDKLRTKLSSTTFCAINLIALMMNMITLQKSVLCLKIESLCALVKAYCTFAAGYIANYANVKGEQRMRYSQVLNSNLGY